jgi:hypothetical protein
VKKSERMLWNQKIEKMVGDEMRKLQTAKLERQFWFFSAVELGGGQPLRTQDAI